MKELFIPFEQALVLKELGFNEPCFGFYVDGELRGINLGIEELGGVGPYYQRFGFHNISNSDINNTTKVVTTAPIYSQAFKWFRDTYKLHQRIEQYYGVNFYFHIEDMVHHRRFDLYPVAVLRVYNESTSQEAAELECLKRLIEIVKTK